jgi:hypothetical protein
MDEERAEALAQFMAITSQEADVAMNMLEVEGPSLHCVLSTERQRRRNSF